MSTFDSEFYRRFRPYYPAEAFFQFEANLKASGFEEPYQIADIGCGTGHSAISLLNTGIQAKIVGVDPDPKMIEQARYLSKQAGYPIQFQQGTGDQTHLNSKSLDGVIIGSAFHWMDSLKTKEELARITKPQGRIRIMEYQFPKAPGSPELNEWIRRQFNSFWKAPNQKPRGTFEKLLSVFNSDPRFSVEGSGAPPMSQSLTVDDLQGLLWSQSRVLCYLNTLTEAEKADYYLTIQRKLAFYFNNAPMQFNFRLQWTEFKRSF